jgi:hypothetical protein
MKRLSHLTLAAALVIAVAAPAVGGELRLSMAGGLVTLTAKDVTVREILAEWARVGQTRIVNAEKLTGGPVTLQLDNVPEAQALDTVLRSAAGYVMAARTAGSPGPSVYDRIMILASSRPPVVAAGVPPPMGNRAMPQVPQNVPQDDDSDQVVPAGGNMINLPMGAQPGVAIMPPPAQPGAAVMPQPVQPGVMSAPVQPGQPGQTPQPQAPMTAPRPGMLPPPPPAPAVVNPFLGTPPGPTAPGYNPVPPPPVTVPRTPGGGV